MPFHTHETDRFHAYLDEIENHHVHIAWTSIWKAVPDIPLPTISPSVMTEGGFNVDWSFGSSYLTLMIDAAGGIEWVYDDTDWPIGIKYVTGGSVEEAIPYLKILAVASVMEV